MKRMIHSAAILLLCICLFAAPVLAAGTGATLTGPGTVRAGDTITLTFHVNGTGIYGASGVLSYDSSVLELKQTKQIIGNGWAVEFNGNHFVAYDNNLANSINRNTELFSVSFQVKSDVATGTALEVSCTDVMVSDGSADVTIGTVSYSATIAAPLSTDSSLKSLTVSNATISPAFSAGKTSYTAEVPFEISKLEVKAEANDSKAQVSIKSPTLTPDGTTKVTVTVTAENGDKKTYTISVKRAKDPNYVASSNNDLAGITVDGYVLSPGFTAESTQYVIWLPYETENVTVNGLAADSKASVTVEGGSGLAAGADNEIKVICTAEDGTQKIYTVIAKRAAAHGSNGEPATPPGTEPETQPTTPAPTVPQCTETTEKDGGIGWWVLLIVAIACFAGGTALGILVGKKFLRK